MNKAGLEVDFVVEIPSPEASAVLGETREAGGGGAGTGVCSTLGGGRVNSGSTRSPNIAW
jgi:hypothetical protein